MLNNVMTHPIVIVGAGWAGLSAALTLARSGKQVVVLEAGIMPGGRARGISFEGRNLHKEVLDNEVRDNGILDNGQHLLLGGYNQVLSQLKLLNIKETEVFQREAFNVLIHRGLNHQNLDFKKTNTNIIHLKSFSALPTFSTFRTYPAFRAFPAYPAFSAFSAFPNFLASLPLLLGGLFAKGLSLKERWALAYFFKNLRRASRQAVEGLSIRDLLHHFKQPLSLIQSFWEPLALAALSTPLPQASASIFLNVLQKSFTLNSQYSDLLFPKVDLSSIFPVPVCNYLTTTGHSVFYRERALNLMFENNRCVGVKTSNQLWRASAVILAIPPYAAAKLLPEHSAFSELNATLNAFDYHPITTAYLKFKPEQIPKFKSRLMGFTQGIAQWMFDLSTIKKTNMLSVVVTGKGEHSDWEPSQLVKKLVTEIQEYYPTLPEPQHSKVITEKRAAFCCNPEIVKRRPLSQSPVAGLALAGDHINTEFPATLEGAVQSGITAAELLLLDYEKNTF